MRGPRKDPKKGVLTVREGERRQFGGVMVGVLVPISVEGGGGRQERRGGQREGSNTR